MNPTPPPARHRRGNRPSWARIPGLGAVGRRGGGPLLPPGHRRRLAAAAAVLVLVAVAVAALISRPESVRHTAARPPTPPSPSAASTSIGRSTSSPPSKVKAAPKPITCSAPARSPLGGVAPASICIPSIRVQASVMQLGLNSDRTVQVPPLSRVGDAGWYKYSAAPGAVGPTVILGHVDSAQFGTGVFFRLGQLRSGDAVTLSRADGRTAIYRIQRVVEVSKQKFPSMAVYGPTSGPALRLVTCGGKFDSATGNYEDNIIAYGSLQSFASA